MLTSGKWNSGQAEAGRPVDHVWPDMFFDHLGSSKNMGMMYKIFLFFLSFLPGLF